MAVGETGPDAVNSYTLMNTYGEINQTLEDVGPSAVTNFHTGIDIAKEDIGTDSWCENVWVVEGGVLTGKYPNQIGQSVLLSHLPEGEPSSTINAGDLTTGMRVSIRSEYAKVKPPQTRKHTVKITTRIANDNKHGPQLNQASSPLYATRNTCPSSQVVYHAFHVQ